MILRSKDVIHAFYVPKFLFKRDVVPGRENNFDFTIDPADANQTFRGQCAEFCGTFHSTMLFTVKALSPADFNDLAATRQSATAASAAAPSRRLRGRACGGAAAGSRPLDLTAHNIAYDAGQPAGPGRPAVRDQLHQQRRGRHPQRRRSPTAPARSSSRARSSAGPTVANIRSRPWPPGRTPSPARFTRR